MLAMGLALALVAPACAGGSSSSPSRSSGSRSTGAAISLSTGLSSAIERHATGHPFSVELTDMGGHRVVGVGLFDGTTARGVYFNATSGAYVEDRAEPAMDAEEEASLTALRERLATSSTTLRSTLRMVESRYVMGDVTSVALLVRGSSFLVRVVTGTGSSEVEHYHDAVSGERSSLPDAGVDAGPPDAGPIDAGRDAGPRDAGRRR